MRKRLNKKLVLHRETLNRLEPVSLRDVAGGATTYTPICCVASGSCPPPPTGDDRKTCAC